MPETKLNDQEIDRVISTTKPFLEILFKYKMHEKDYKEQEQSSGFSNPAPAYHHDIIQTFCLVIKGIVEKIRLYDYNDMPTYDEGTCTYDMHDMIGTHYRITRKKYIDESKNTITSSTIGYTISVDDDFKQAFKEVFECSIENHKALHRADNTILTDLEILKDHFSQISDHYHQKQQLIFDAPSNIAPSKKRRVENVQNGDLRSDQLEAERHSLNAQRERQ